MELEPKFIFSYISRAFIKAEAGDHNGAIADINLAIQDQPDSDWLYVLRGQLRKRAGDLDNAVQDYDRALYIKPTSARALYARGIANYLKGEYRLAVADIESSIILEPDKQGYKSVMLYLATIGNGGDGTSDLVNNTRHIDAAAWPAPIVSLFLEKSTPHELISSIQEQNPYKRRARVCAANYFVSQRYLLRGEKTQATYFLRETIRHCPRSTIQYVGAVSDLK
ncbi:MAG: hypothetical protein A2140_09900 [Candidatus Muproteobacteria bacterium RBG_16_62_13]|uniref:Uncharacterized protein n=1 Tax=Candidatus Muproteobacteria bacterium RBG_16_62_13 TaxID=1817756 RepID=A0A1F6SYS3_9PROT|nr:MAG: hypothetical protein A2140_09900 [Candidatus Muproteobacteria bacterium RBG_16_62_13]